MDEHGTIIIADDDEDDIVLFQRSLKSVGVLNPTIVLRSGLELMDYLARRNQYENRSTFPWPVLAFVDARMPLHDCFDVLNWVREQCQSLQNIPFVVMSGSINPAEQMRALALGAKAFYSKPLEGERLKDWVERCLAETDKPKS